jgi:hypothetical protein
MAETVFANLSGHKAVLLVLEQLPAAVENRVLKHALREAAKPILKSARANAPKDTGALRKGVKIVAWKRKPGRVGFTIGLTPDIAFYGYLQEEGWSAGKRPWKSHRSERSVEARLNELEAIGKRQKFDRSKKAGRRELRGFISSLRAARANLAARKADTRRKIPGKFFIRRAYDAHKQAAADRMGDLIVKGMEKEAERLAKKMKAAGVTPVV